MGIEDLPVASNDDQLNMDKLSNTFLDKVGDSMGSLQDTEPGGRPFLSNDRDSFSGYNGVVVRGGKIVSLINRDGDEAVPNINLGTEVTIVGNSRDYVSSGHKPGDKVVVIRIIEPFYTAEPGIQSSDKIIKVEGAGAIGWIKPSELDKTLLKAEIEKEIQKLFESPSKSEE